MVGRWSKDDLNIPPPFPLLLYLLFAIVVAVAVDISGGVAPPPPPPVGREGKRLELVAVERLMRSKSSMSEVGRRKEKPAKYAWRKSWSQVCRLAGSLSRQRVRKSSWSLNVAALEDVGEEDLGSSLASKGSRVSGMGSVTPAKNSFVRNICMWRWIKSPTVRRMTEIRWREIKGGIN